MVIDTSILLAVIFNEDHASWSLKQLESNKEALRMSTVNLAETLILIKDRQPQQFESIEQKILSMSLRFVSPSVEHARIASQARLKFPLNLGDCFAYALAYDEGCSVLTLDRDFLKTDIEVMIPR